jgi:hypothetical protein
VRPSWDLLCTSAVLSDLSVVWPRHRLLRHVLCVLLCACSAPTQPTLSSDCSQTCGPDIDCFGMCCVSCFVLAVPLPSQPPTGIAAEQPRNSHPTPPQQTGAFNTAVLGAEPSQVQAHMRHPVLPHADPAGLPNELHRQHPGRLSCVPTVASCYDVFRCAFTSALVSRTCVCAPLALTVLAVVVLCVQHPCLPSPQQGTTLLPGNLTAVSRPSSCRQACCTQQG